MPFQHGNLLAGGEVVHPDRLVAAARDDDVLSAARCDGDAIDQTLMSFQHGDLLA